MHISAFVDALDCFLYLESRDLLYNQDSAASYLPIHYACYNSSYEVLCYILAKDPGQARVLPVVDHHLILLAVVSGSPEVLSLLLQHGANVQDPANVRNGAVAAAIRRRHVESLRVLLEHNVRGAHDVEGFSTLMLAIKYNEPDAVPMLIECGEDVNYVTTLSNLSALFLACFQGERWLDVVRLICDRATKLDLDPLINDKAAIHWACASKSLEIIRTVVEHGVDVNRRDKDRRTGVHEIVDRCDEDLTIRILELLVENGLALTGLNAWIVVDFVKSIMKPCRVIEWLFERGVQPGEILQGRTVADYLKEASKTNRAMGRIYQRWCAPSAKQ